MSPSTTAVAESQFIDFQPTKEAASDILCAMVDPDETLSDIARRFGTTLDALTDWLDSPPVLARIEKMKRVIAMRDEFILTAQFRTALAVLLSILDGHQHDEQHIPVDPQNLKSVTQRDRRRAAARLAATQFIRLARAGWRGRAGSSPIYHGDASDPQSTPVSPPSSLSPGHRPGKVGEFGIAEMRADESEVGVVGGISAAAVGVGDQRERTGPRERGIGVIQPSGHDELPCLSEPQSACAAAPEYEGVQSPHGQHDHDNTPQAPPRRGEEVPAQEHPPPDRR